MMKMKRYWPTHLLTLGLLLCLLFSAAVPARALEFDTDKLLENMTRVFGVTKEDFENYEEQYANSLPVGYKPNANSQYVALGGDTVGGTYGLSNKNDNYANQVAGALKVNYLNKATKKLASSGVASYIKKQKTYISKADLITFQMDSSEILQSSMNGILDGTQADWSKYISDPEILAFISTFRGEMINAYGPQVGEENAHAIAMIMEYVLYECVISGFETINAVKQIREYNSDALIVVLGIYNPLQGLGISMNDTTIEVGEMVEYMVQVSNTYLFVQTQKMENTAFVEAGQATVAGYGIETISFGDLTSMITQVRNIIRSRDRQYADLNGHNYMRDQLLEALKEPCFHTETTLANEKKATCTEKGYTGDTVCTNCNKVVKHGTAIAATGHAFGDWTVSQASTCVAEGTQTRTCKNCGETEHKALAMIDHKWDKGVVTKEATCTAKGEKTTTCQGCGKATVEEIAMIDHKWDKGVVTKEATCTAKGEKTTTCQGCGKATVEEIAMIDHKWDKGVVTKEATCTTKGEKTFTCSGCGKTNVEKIAVTDHTWDDGVVTKEATCTAKGEKKYTCSGCGKTNSKTLAIIEHAWDEGVITTAPTCEAEGVKTTTCTGCGKTTTEAVAVIEHAWDEGVITTAPTCEAEGVKTTTCTGCGKTTTEAIAIIEHVWNEGEITTAPGCEAVGQKTTTCTGCGKTTTETVPATGHRFGEYVSNGDATCQKDGTKTSTCAGCGAKDTVADESTRTEHVYKEGACTFCGAADSTAVEEPDKQNSMVWILIGGAAVVLIGVGVAIVLLGKKKRA